MTTRITGLLLFAATVVVVAPRLYAIQDCHDDVGRLVPRSSAVVVATITAIGTRNGPPCPGFPPSVSYPEGQRCGLFQTFDLHVEKQLMRIPAQAEHRFRAKVNTCSGMVNTDSGHGERSFRAR